MKLKVLPNEFQDALQFHERMMNRGNPLGRREEFDLFEHYPDHPVVFNRVGYYLTPDDCWLEFQRSDGTYKAIRYERDSFKYHLDIAIAKDNPIPDSDWQLINILVTRKQLVWEKRYIMEDTRRELQRISRDCRKHFIGVKKRIKVKLEQRKPRQSKSEKTGNHQT